MTLRNVAKRLYQAGHDLIPLAVRGKKPLQTRWTTRPRTPKSELLAAIRNGCNLGLRLKDTDLIIDVDVKNNAKGLTSYASLIQDYPELKGVEPCTDTPTGGFHVRLTKPPGKAYRTHGTYPGIDFMSQGGQVLIGGCETDVGIYVDHPDAIFPAASEALVELLNRAPVSDAKIARPGAWDDTKLAIALKTLDAAPYRTDEDWLRMAMACHHSTNGAGRQAFLDWSATDPLYKLADFENGERWDSLRTDKPGGVTGIHLVKQLREAEQLDLAEQLTLSLADVGNMFDVEHNPQADAFAAATELISNWGAKHRASELYAKLVEYEFDDSDTDRMALLIRKRIGVRVGVVRVGIAKARAEALALRGEAGAAVGDEIEFIYRMVEASGGPDSIVNSEGLLWMWRPELGYYAPLVGDLINAAILEYAAEAHEIILPGALPRLNTVLRAEAGKITDTSFWDTSENDEGIINTKAGEVVLQDQEWQLRSHDMAHRLRGVTKFEFGHEGTPKHWMKWLNDSFTTENLSVMSRRIAVGIVYTLMSSKPFLKKAWLLYGPPNTGKSMLIKVLGEILGLGNYSATGLSKMLGNHGTAPLVGKMANFQSEIDVSERMDAATFKAIVSGDHTEANPKNAHQFMFQNRAVLWMAGNNLPKFAVDTTEGVLDRLVPVAFQNAVATSELDRGLINKLNRESDRIVTWALWLYSEEYMFDFPCLELSGDSAIEAELKDEMATDEEHFMDQCIEVTKNLEHFVPADDLHDTFNQWNRGMPKSKIGFTRMFYKQLRFTPGLRENKDYAIGTSTRKPQRRGVFGIKLKDIGNA